MLHMKVMQEVHDVPMARHFDDKTMKVTLSKNFYWFKMKEDIKHYVANLCEIVETPS